jgi:hypothetical protein
MWEIFDGLNIPGLSIGDGMITMPLWAMATLLAVLTLFVVMTFVRGGVISLTVLIALVAIGVGVNWVLTEMQRMQNRRTLEARLAELSRNALLPDSTLACLDGNDGDALEKGCEQALFASAGSLAAARAYSASRLTLLADGMRFAVRQDADFEDRIRPLRASIERDRFGIASHVLMTDKGCSADQCDTFTLLRDPTKLRANMRAKTFDALLTRYAPTWSASAQRATETPPANETPHVAVAPSDAPAPETNATAGAPAASTDATPMPQPRPPRRTAARPRPPASPPIAFSPARP